MGFLNHIPEPLDKEKLLVRFDVNIQYSPSSLTRNNKILNTQTPTK